MPDRPAVDEERCLRCEGELRWVHQTWQCSVCRFKLGCCEGEPAECAQAPAQQAVAR